MQILVLPGDGIGPEITAATRDVLRAASDRFGLGLALEDDVVGHESLRRYGTTVRPERPRQGPQRGRADPRSDRHLRFQGRGARRNQPVHVLSQEPRPVRQYPAGAHLSGRTGTRRRLRPRGGAREHRRVLCRPQHGTGQRRDAGHPRRGDLAAADHARVLRPHRTRRRSSSPHTAASTSASCTRPMC